MNVQITYIGINGNHHTMTVSSADEAMEKLNAIDGYGRTPMDDFEKYIGDKK